MGEELEQKGAFEFTETTEQSGGYEALESKGGDADPAADPQYGRPVWGGDDDDPELAAALEQKRAIEAQNQGGDNPNAGRGVYGGYDGDEFKGGSDPLQAEIENPHWGEEVTGRQEWDEKGGG